MLPHTSTSGIGIYLHIPFCKQACHYCNFHFSTQLSGKQDFIEALLREISLRKEDAANRKIRSVYLGGGTPSLLDKQSLQRIFSCLENTFDILPGAEITLEANPDDIYPEMLETWRQVSINRLSIGIQTFQDHALRAMNRAHTALEAKRAMDLLEAAGFDRYTADLIYGIPGVSDEQWLEDIGELLSRKIPHLSAYCLTVEEHTALAHFVKKGRLAPVEEEQALRQFEILLDTMEAAGYIHYEISNFARPGNEAQHNSAYWLGREYLGFGPSAHSFQGKRRYWNLPHNASYTRNLLSGLLPGRESEMLTPNQQYNEYVLTRLRTCWGCSAEDMAEPYRSHFLLEVARWMPEMVMETKGVYTLTRKGKIMADAITSDLFVVD